MSLIITEEQRYANGTLVIALSTFATVISIIGSSLIVLTYLFYKDIRTPSRHIIACISLSDLVVSLGKFYMIYTTSPDQQDDIQITCTIQSFIVTTAMLCSFMWTMALATFLNILVIGRSPQWAESLLHPYFHLVCWLVPLAINVVALCTKKLGTSHDYASSGWCWIKVDIEQRNGRFYITNKNDAVLWMTLDGKFIEIISYIVVLILFIRIKCYIKEKIKVYDECDSRLDRHLSSPVFVTKKAVQAAKTTDRKLIFIPIALILLRIWGTVRYILFILDTEERPCISKVKLSDKVLMIFQIFGDNIIGAVNCVLFCFLTPKVWNHMKTSCLSIVKYRCHGRTSPERAKLLAEAP